MPKTPAEIEATLREMSAVSAELSKGIDGNIAALEARAKALQAELFDMIVADFLTGLSTADGVVANSAGNFAKVSAIDRLFNALRRIGLGEAIVSLNTMLGGVISAVGDYFRIAFAKGKVDAIAQSNAKIYARIGVKDGELIPGGYLDRLAQADQLRNELKNFMLSAISQKTRLTDLTKGLSILIKGNKDADGFLQRYFRQYAYDTFNQVREIKNEEFAEGLGLQWFVYQGSVIDTTRKFCKKRAGKVFSTKEAKKWKDDPDLIDPKTKATYNPLIERGRYNCRHWIDYVSEETAIYLKNKQNAS